ncbi:hypothetical protein SDC9_201532 [bioreactor metagenome]|uniref:Uncharacterized protein n=1 Tax=bioreactor metagenome TaxID=1076179 RepID=A0A645J043_9ZZZZ
MRGNNAAEFPIHGYDKDGHSHKHQRALERVRIHNAFHPTEEYIRGNDDGKHEQGNVVIDF